jgi:hypothetical protein
MNDTDKQKQKEQAHAFYSKALTLLNESDTKYMLGGAFALFHYTGIYRDTKDLDVFCKYDAFSKILAFFAEKGYRTEITDIRWLGKIFDGDYFIDIIFSSPNNICIVDDSWYQYATRAHFEGVETLLLPPEELIWCKCYVQNRERFDGADVNHLLLKYGKQLDWQRLLTRMDQHWHVLLAQLLLFQFVYPADFHDIIPKWLFDELMNRAQDQYKLPSAVEKVCRGPLLDQTQYGIDIKEWNYKALTLKSV